MHLHLNLAPGQLLQSLTTCRVQGHCCLSQVCDSESLGIQQVSWFGILQSRLSTRLDVFTDCWLQGPCCPHYVEAQYTNASSPNFSALPEESACNILPKCPVWQATRCGQQLLESGFSTVWGVCCPFAVPLAYPLFCRVAGM